MWVDGDSRRRAFQFGRSCDQDRVVIPGERRYKAVEHETFVFSGRLVVQASGREILTDVDQQDWLHSKFGRIRARRRISGRICGGKLQLRISAPVMASSFTSR